MARPVGTISQMLGRAHSLPCVSDLRSERGTPLPADSPLMLGG